MKWIIAAGILLIGLSFGQIILPSIMTDFAGTTQDGHFPSGWVLVETVLVWIFAGSIATVMYKLFSR
jgi:thiosulfate reductase cytochrome b subunit